MKILRVGVLIFAIVSSGVSFAAATLTVVPPHPVHNEAVYIRVQADGAFNPIMFEKARSYVTSLPSGGFRIVAVSGIIAVPPENSDPVDYTFYLGRLPVGFYTIDLGFSEDEEDVSVGAMTFEVTTPDGRYTSDGPRSISQDDVSGLWYDPSQPGTSLVLQQGANSLKVGGGIYLYNASNQPTWFLLAPGDWETAERFAYRFDLFQTAGTAFTAQYNPADTSVQKVGGGRFEIRSRDEIEFEYSIGSFNRTVILKRFEL